MLRGLVSLACVLVVSACYKTPTPPCGFVCGSGGACPDGYGCSADDNLCHLVEAGGGLASCPNSLPPDAAAQIDSAPTPDSTPIDAVSIDATPIDAMPLDAGPPDANLPPVLGAITSPQSFVAGDAISITATATDPETPPETLTFSAPFNGTHQDPYQDFGSGDTVGGAFSTTTHAFTMPAGVLGTFDLDVTVCDTLPSCDHQVVSVQVAASPVELNEIVFEAGGAEDVELINTSNAAVDLTGWTVVAPFAEYDVDNAVTIGANAELVVHWNQTGTDSTTDLYTCNHTGGCTLPTIASTLELAMFGAHDVLTRDLRDFVKWGTGALTAVTRAVQAGQWPSTSTSDYVDTTGLGAGTSIARTIGANTETAADWFIDATPTPGAANTP